MSRRNGGGGSGGMLCYYAAQFMTSGLNTLSGGRGQHRSAPRFTPEEAATAKAVRSMTKEQYQAEAEHFLTQLRRPSPF